MYEKDTSSLLAELRAEKDPENYLKRNRTEMVGPLCEYLEKLLRQKGLTKKEVIKASGLDRFYAYQLFSGRREKPTRPKLLAVAFAMKLTCEETQYLLRYAGLGMLYPRNPWDAAVIAALEKGLSVVETNLLLSGLGEDILLE